MLCVIIIIIYVISCFVYLKVEKPLGPEILIKAIMILFVNLLSTITIIIDNHYLIVISNNNDDNNYKVWFCSKLVSGCKQANVAFLIN